MNWSGPGSINSPKEDLYHSKTLCIEKWDDRIPQDNNKHCCGLLTLKKAISFRSALKQVRAGDRTLTSWMRRERR